jgi:hypothetical protein
MRSDLGQVRRPDLVVEEPFEEALLTPLVRRPVMAAEVLTMPPVSVIVVVPFTVSAVIVIATAIGTGSPAPRGGRCAPAPASLGVDEPLQLAAIEEDPATFHALIHVHAVALVLPHLAMALRTGQGAHAEPNGLYRA